MLEQKIRIDMVDKLLQHTSSDELVKKNKEDINTRKKRKQEIYRNYNCL